MDRQLICKQAMKDVEDSIKKQEELLRSYRVDVTALERDLKKREELLHHDNGAMDALKRDLKEREESIRRHKNFIELEELSLAQNRQVLRFVNEEYERRYPPSKTPG
jgi:hypothetical protein